MELEVEPNGLMFGTFQVPKVLPPKNWGCICHPEKKFRRWHLTCHTFCRFKRVLKGKMPARIPLSMYTLFIQRNRKGLWWKEPLLHAVVVIAELLAN
jgi:hypothetical protein